MNINSKKLFKLRLFKKILFIFFLLFSVQIFSQVSFREFSQELSQPYVYSINQDINGYLWIGTGNGLTRYDGINFKSYSVKDSLADNFITCSFINKENCLFGHMNGRISNFDGKRFKPLTFFSHSIITDIEKNSIGEIWASSFSNGFVLLNNKSASELKPRENQIPVFSFKFLEKEELLVGSVNGLLHCRLKSGELKLLKKVDGVPTSKISDIIKTRKGSGFYIATENEGIYKADIKGKTITITPVGVGLNIDFSGIQSIFEDSNLNLWISTFGNGIIKLNYLSTNKFHHPELYNKSTGFSTNHVKIIYEDREGNIWSGNYGTGLTQIIGKTFLLDSFDEQKYGSGIFSIYVSDKIKWLGTDKGLLKINQSTNEILRFYSNTNGLPSDKVTSIFYLNNELWIGTEKNGIFRMAIDKEKFISYEITKGALENSITIITGKNNQIWVGTKKGVCNIDLISNTNHWYTHSQGGLPHNSVNHLLIDSKDKVWVLTLSNTLAVIENGIVGKKIIFSEKRIHSLGPIIEENDSTFWIGSLGSGVFQIKADTLINLTTKEGLLSDYCYSMILEDKNLWIGHRGGMSKIKINNFFIKSIQDLNDIKSSCEFNPNAIFKDEKNRVSFGTSEGLLTYDHSLENKHVLLPPVLNITSLKINDKEVDYNQKIVLPSGHYKIEIDYIGINLKEPALTNYKYELAGFDRSSENTSNNSVVYPNLSEGEYTFKLWAYSGEGIMTTNPLTLTIIINTPIWKHWWFYILIIILFQIVFILYNKKRELKHIQEKRVLEAKVRERTSELAQKNALLQEKQQEIINQNKELEKYQNYLEELVMARTIELLNAKNKAEESDKLKTAILNNLSHEIRTPMNAICGFTKLLNDESLTKREKSNYIKIINQNTESLLSFITEILDISLIEANQLTISNDKVDIDELLSDLEKQYKLINKNIVLEFTNKIQENRSFIYCDIARLKQVITNFLNNAFKFTDSGHIQFGYELINNYAKFFVSDTGIGIAKSDLDKIFDLFHKIENNPKKFYRGAGIGLATNKKIVELMGGEIWVESVVNKGTTFYFTLPVNSEAIEGKHFNLDKNNLY